MSDMDLVESEAGEKIYNATDVVWVKLSGMWWPAEVQDQETLDPEITSGLRKQPLCVVKFMLEEDEEQQYFFIKSLDQIYHYNCRKKMEFLRVGYKKYSKTKNEKKIQLWPSVIQEAERRTGGNPDIINDPEILPEAEKPEASVSKSVSSGKKSSLAVRAGARQSLPAGRFSSASIVGARRETKSLGGCSNDSKDKGNKSSSNYVSYVIPRRQCPPADDEPQPDPINCMRCDFKTVNMDWFIMHYQMNHIGRRPYPPPKSFSAIAGPSKPKKVRKRKEESASPIIKKKKKKSISGKEPKLQQKKKKTPPVALEVSQEYEQILKDWDEDDDTKEDNETSPSDEMLMGETDQENKTSPPEDMLVDEIDTAQVIKEPVDSVVPIDKNGPPVEAVESVSKTPETPAPPPKSSSCFDFDDEEPAQPEVQTLKFGQKLPRVISPEKPKSSATDIMSDGRELESFLKEVSVPELPSIPSARHAGSSLKEVRGGKKSLASPVRETEKKSYDVKVGGLSVPGKQTLEDKTTASSDNKELQSEEKHFLVEGPLQSRKRKGSGLTEGNAEDGSAGKKLKCYGDDEPSTEDVQSVDNIEKVGGQQALGLLEDGTTVLDKLEEAATIITVDPHVSPSESVKTAILSDATDQNLSCDVPNKSKSTVSELDKQSLIDTLTYSPTSVDTESSEKKKKINKSLAVEIAHRGKDSELEVEKSAVVSDLDKQSLIDTLTHSPAPVDSSTPRKRKSKQDPSKKSPKTPEAESSITPESSKLSSGSRNVSTDGGGTPSSRSRSSKNRVSNASPTKGKHSEVSPSCEKHVELISPKSSKSRNSRRDRNSRSDQDLDGKGQPSVGEDVDELFGITASPTPPKSKKKKIGRPRKSSEKSVKESSSGHASEPVSTTEKTNEFVSNDITKPENLLGVEAGVIKHESDIVASQMTMAIGIETDKPSFGADPTESISFEKDLQNRLRSKSGAGLDIGPSIKPITPTDTKKCEAPAVAQSIDESISQETSKNSENQIELKIDALESDLNSTKSVEALSEKFKIVPEKNEFFEVSKLMTLEQNEQSKSSVVEDTSSVVSSPDEKNRDGDKHKTKEGDKSSKLNQPASVDDSKTKKGSKEIEEVGRVHKKHSNDKHKSVSKLDITNSTKKDKSKEKGNVLDISTHKKDDHSGKPSKDKHSKESSVSFDKSPSKLAPSINDDDSRPPKHKRSSRADDRKAKLQKSSSSPSKAVTTSPIVTDHHSPKATTRDDKEHSRSKRSPRSSESQAQTKERISCSSKSTPTVAKDKRHSKAVDEGNTKNKRSSRSSDNSVEAKERIKSPSKNIPPATPTVAKGKGHSEAFDDKGNKSKGSPRSSDSYVGSKERTTSSNKSAKETNHSSTTDAKYDAHSKAIDENTRSKRSSHSFDSRHETKECISKKNLSASLEVAKDEEHAKASEDKGNTKMKRSSNSSDSLLTKESKSQVESLEPKSSPSKRKDREVSEATATGFSEGLLKSKRTTRYHDREVKQQESSLNLSETTHIPTEVEKIKGHPEAVSSNLEDDSVKMGSSCSHASQVTILKSSLSPIKAASTIGEVGKYEERTSPITNDDLLHSNVEHSFRSHVSHTTQEPISTPSKMTDAEVATEVVRSEATALTMNDEMGHSKRKRSSRSHGSQVKVQDTPGKTPKAAKDKVRTKTTANDGERHSSRRRSSRSNNTPVGTLEVYPKTTEEVAKDEVPSDAASTANNALEPSTPKRSSRSHDPLVESVSSPCKKMSTVTEDAKEEVRTEAAALSVCPEKVAFETIRSPHSKDSPVESVDSMSSPKEGISAAIEEVEGILNNSEVDLLESRSIQNENADTAPVVSSEAETVSDGNEVGLMKHLLASESHGKLVATVSSPSEAMCTTLEVAVAGSSDKKAVSSSSDEFDLKKGIDVVITPNELEKSYQPSILEANPINIVINADYSSPEPKEHKIIAHAGNLVDPLKEITVDATSSPKEAPLVVPSKDSKVASNKTAQAKKTASSKELAKETIIEDKHLLRDENVSVPIDEMPVHLLCHSQAEKQTMKETKPVKRSKRISSRDMLITQNNNGQCAKEVAHKVEHGVPVEVPISSCQPIKEMKAPLRRSMRSSSQDVKNIKEASKDNVSKPESSIEKREREKAPVSNEALPTKRSKRLSSREKMDQKSTSIDNAIKEPKTKIEDGLQGASELMDYKAVVPLDTQPETALENKAPSETTTSAMDDGEELGLRLATSPTVPELVGSVVKKDEKIPGEAVAVSHAGEPTLRVSMENEKEISISGNNETKSEHLASTLGDEVAIDSIYDSEPTVKGVQAQSDAVFGKELLTPSKVNTEERLLVAPITTQENLLDPADIPGINRSSTLLSPMLASDKSPQKETASNQKLNSVEELAEKRLEKDVSLSSSSSKSTYKTEYEFKTPTGSPQSIEASSLGSTTPTKVFGSLPKDVPIVGQDDGSKSKAQLSAPIVSVVSKDNPPTLESAASISPKKSVALVAENVHTKEVAKMVGVEPIPSSPLLTSLVPESEHPILENKGTSFDGKFLSSVPCNLAPSSPSLSQTAFVSSSISPNDPKQPKVPEKREKNITDLPQAPVVIARASRWDNPFPTKKIESRPSTPTHQLLTSPTKMSHSPANKVKVEIKSGLVRSLKSPNVEGKCESINAKYSELGVIKLPSAHQEVTRSLNVETTLPELTTMKAPDFDDELSALQAEIASYSHPKVRDLPKPDPSDESNKADPLRHELTQATTNLDENSSRESKTDKIEEVTKNKWQDPGPSQVCSKEQIMDLGNSLAFDVPLDSIPLPDSPKKDEMKLKETPPPTPNVPGLSEAALLASLLKGEDDDLPVRKPTNAVAVTAPKKEVTKSLPIIAKSEQSAKSGIIDKRNDCRGFTTKSNLLRPVVTNLASVPVVISSIPLPLSEPSISSSEVNFHGTVKPKQQAPTPIVIPVEPPKVSLKNQVPTKSYLEDTPTSRVEVLEVERSQPQEGLVGGIDPSKLLDINDIPFVFEEDLIEEGLMPSEPNLVHPSVMTNVESRSASTVTGPTATEKTNEPVSSTAGDLEETFCIEDLVEEVVEEEPATDSTLSGNVVSENNSTYVESNEHVVFTARRVRQFFIDVVDENDPEFEYYCSLPLAPIGLNAGCNKETVDPPAPVKKVAQVSPIHPKKITTEPKLVNLGNAGNVVGGVSNSRITPHIIRLQSIKTGKVNKPTTAADLERRAMQATTSSQPESTQMKEPLQLRLVKDAKTGATKFMVKPHMVQQLSKSASKQLILSQQLKSAKSPASVVTSNTLATKNPSLIQINKGLVSSPRLLQRGASQSSQRRTVRQPVNRGSTIPIQRPARPRMPSEMVVTSSTMRVPVDHSGLILTNNNVTPESTSTNQVLLSGSSSNQFVLSTPANQQTGSKFVSFLVNKPEPKKAGKDLLEQALTGLDVQNDEAPTITPTATLMYGMLTDPLQQRPIMTTAVQPSQVILSHDQLLAYEAPDDPSSTVSNTRTNR